MTKLGIVFVAALVLCGSIVSAQGRELQCSYALGQYHTAIEQFEKLAAQARVQAEQNPLYESDVAYYAGVLADAKKCAKNLAPVTTAAR